MAAAAVLEMALGDHVYTLAQSRVPQDAADVDMDTPAESQLVVLRHVHARAHSAGRLLQAQNGPIAKEPRLGGLHPPLTLPPTHGNLLWRRLSRLHGLLVRHPLGIREVEDALQ